MKRTVPARNFLAPLILVFVLVSIPAAAVDTLHFDMAVVEGPGWKAENVALGIDWRSPTDAAITISAARLQLPPPLTRLTEVMLTCPNTIINAEAMRCQGGTLHLKYPVLDSADINVDLTYYQASGALDVSLKNIRLAGGAGNVTGRLTPAGWQFDVMGKALDTAKLPAVVQDFMDWPTDIKSTGKLTIDAHLVGRENKLGGLKLNGAVSSLNFSDADGHRASEKLATNFQINAQPGPNNDWNFHGRVSANAGQLYLEPIFLEFPRTGIKLSTRGIWNSKRNKLSFTQLGLDHPEVAQAQARLELKLNPLQVESATLKVVDAAFAPFYKTYLQPLLIGTAFDALESTGRIGIEMSYQTQSVASVTVKMNDASLKDGQGRFGLNGMNGKLAWTRGTTSLHSDFGWQDGHVYKLALGTSRLKLQSSQGNLELLKPTNLPVLDGALQIKNLNVQKLGTPDMSLQLTGALTPVSMEAFSAAMDWPLMSGKFSSVIPNLSYTKNAINIGGDLQVRVFDGAVTVRNLRLEQPFGVLPLLSADIAINKIDLDALTRTFSFGKIQGKLSGAIDDLRMANWVPVAFNARFATPADDKSRHRISQKAVNSLSSLGGASGMLSRSLLRFFDEFSYARLGLSCRLSKGVCEMGGVEPAENGYYIVKGGGIPRIDVRGFATEVDWNVLVERLKNATRSEGPVVQ
ncbi:MAG: hypothetical protein ABIQ54_01700 [Gammaproteobacteria bacterium]